MAHACCSALLHCVFSTKERRPVIVPDLRGQLWACVGGIARGHRWKTIRTMSGGRLRPPLQGGIGGTGEWSQGSVPASRDSTLGYYRSSLREGKCRNLRHRDLP